MIITYHGLSCFKIQSGEITAAIDPPSKKSGLKTPRFQSDVILVTHDHDRHNGAEELMEKSSKDSVFLINSPGEYEIKNFIVNGIGSFHDSFSGEKYGKNTIYYLDIENIKLCHMGDFGESKVNAQIKEQIGKIDILFMPIGGETVIDTSKSVDMITDLEPKIVIPMHYKDEKTLQEFLKEFKEESLKPVEKLVIKKKDISDNDKMKVVVLESN